MTRIHKRAVGVFSDYQNLEMALNELPASGFPMNQVFVVAPNEHAHHWLTGITVRDRWDDIRNDIRSAFSPERVSFYQNRLSRGDYLVIVEGTEDEIRRAESVFSRNRIQDWRIYDDVPESERGLPAVGTVGKNRRAVGVFPTRGEAEAALHELRDSGFPMDRVSVIAKDADRDENIAGAPVREDVGNKADEGAAVGAVSGGVLGGLTGLLVGLGVLALPGIGPIMLAGATATAIATTLSGTAIGAVTGGLLGALIGLGIPEERARVYHDRVARGEYLLIVDGTSEEIARAETILSRRGIEDYGVYDVPMAAVPGVDTKTTTTTAHAVPPINAAAIPVDVPRNKYGVGLFPNLRQAEKAIDDLRNAGFPLSLISLVAQHFDRREQLAGIDLRDRFDAMRMGLPDDRAHFYNDRIAGGDYMVIVNGTAEEVARATSILGDSQSDPLRNRVIQEWQVFDPTTVDYVRPGYVASTPDAAMYQTELGMMGKLVVGLFSSRRDAELAIGDLAKAGFSFSQISLYARNFGPQGAFAGVHLRDRFGDMRMGLPEDRIHFYNDRIARGNYAVVVQGTETEIRRAASILSDRGIEALGIYDAPDYTPGVVASP